MSRPGMPGLLCGGLAVTLAAGCGGTGAGGIHGAWSSERVGIGDTTVVRTLDGSVWGDTMTLAPELRIGELEGDEAYLFGRIASLDVDAAGRILVVDRQAAEVRVYSSEGAYVMTIGREGGGPGEFRRPDHIRVLPDGDILVRDPLIRFSLFSPEGELLRDWPIRSGYATNTGFFLSGGYVLNPDLPGHLVRYALGGTVVDTIPLPSRGYHPAQLEIDIPGGHMSYGIPFSASERWTWTRDGRVLFGRTDEYRIERQGPDDSVFRIERIVEPVPVLDGEADQARDRVLRSIRSSAPSWSWNGPAVPSTKPAWRALIAGVDGSIWVIRQVVAEERPNPEPNGDPPTVWVEPFVVADVFDADGRYMGPVKLPSGMDLSVPPALSLDRVWAAAFHELGHPQVVRYRVRPIDSSPGATGPSGP